MLTAALVGASAASAAGAGGAPSADLPFLGQYYGSGLFAFTAGNERIRRSSEIAHSFFFYGERTGVITQIRQHWRTRTDGYGAGDGGKYSILIVPADPATRLPILGATPICRIDDIVMTGTGIPAATPTDRHNNVTYDFTTQGQLVAKQPYCLVWRNTHANPFGNYVSINVGVHTAFNTTFSPSPSGSGDYAEPSGIDPASVGASVAPVQGWTPVKIDGTTVWYPWTCLHSDGNGYAQRRLGGLYCCLKYSDGQWVGWGNFAGGSTYRVGISGPNYLRERFRVTRASRTASGVFVRIGRLNASGGSLVVTLESGPASDTAANGTTIEQITVPASSIYNLGTQEELDNTDGDTQIDLVPYLWVPFSQSRTLSLGSIYNLRLNASGGGNFSIWCGARSNSGIKFLSNVSGQSLTWEEWAAQRVIEWSAWEDSRGIMISANSGSSWTFTTPQMAPIIFKCA
jgi:hypothetical protein